jgi:hypothetical protein
MSIVIPGSRFLWKLELPLAAAEAPSLLVVTASSVYLQLGALSIKQDLQTRPREIRVILCTSVQNYTDLSSTPISGDREKPGATPPSHRMFRPFLGTNATAWSASPRSKRGSVLAVKGERRGRSTASAVS